MSDNDAKLEANRQLLVDANEKGGASKLMAFIRLSGPGWLQSAITLGGGSLGGALFLGVLGGFAFMWLQPLAMIMGVIMLSAIGYVTLSTGERPFQAINKHINPVLGWGWIVATLMANCVWSLPQFNLATVATRQNLAPGIFGAEAMGDVPAKLIICLVITVICVAFVWSYDSGGKGVKVFDLLLKGVVGLIVLSFFGVVIKLSMSKEGLEWGKILGNLIPDLSLLSKPAPTYDEFLKSVDPAYLAFWTTKIVDMQRSVMISAAATAVGINMTFLLPYSMLKRKWDKDFRGLAIFDLSTGLFVPFILVTGCIVIVSASRFHTKPSGGVLASIVDSGKKDKDGKAIMKLKANGNAVARVKKEMGGDAFEKLKPEEQKARIDGLPEADKKLSSMLVKRSSGALAKSLEPLTGKTFSHYVFGFGVVGMAVSSIIILMLINGFVMCEILDKPLAGWTFKLGALMPLVGILGPFVWGEFGFWLVVPTSNFGMVLLPVAYFTFFLMMNSKSLMKDKMPTGVSRIVWNVLMLIAAGLATFGSLFSLYSNLGKLKKPYMIGGWSLIALFIAAAIAVHFLRPPVDDSVKEPATDKDSTSKA